MGKVFQNKECDICGVYGKVIETWGKKYCRVCWDNKPKYGHGHSGMRGSGKLFAQSELFNKNPLELVICPKSNPVFSEIFLKHYPGSKGIVGRQCNYLIKQFGKIVGIIGGNSPPLNYKKFNQYFGNKYSEDNWLNNNVYCLIDHDKNLGTKVLKLFRNQIKKDYESKYFHKLIGLITFVEPPRNGAVYRADNWDCLGETQGKSCRRRGDHGKWINKEWSDGTKKEWIRVFGSEPPAPQSW